MLLSNFLLEWSTLLLIVLFFLFFTLFIQFSSVQSLSRVWHFATPWIEHASPPCPSPTPRVYPNSCPSSWWWYPAISSSVVPFSSCPQSLPASGFFPMSQLFARGDQSVGVSASASFYPKKSQGWSPSEWTGWISLQSKELSRVFSNTTVQKHQFFIIFMQFCIMWSNLFFSYDLKCLYYFKILYFSLFLSNYYEYLTDS